ncbi:hypothetical protein IFM89_023898 [Coptis chinensis]|uniref:Uncharacterized protein n=1 Tax=Coptis chinensis TaxID=261450 RepID=A0A835LZE3_9MAGN|nr:hypothetical protein IFM89_023898 [Coptis chinensis]
MSSFLIMPVAPKKDEMIDYSLSEKDKKTLEYIEDVTSNPDDVQKRVLAEITTRNAHVEYLQRHGLNGRTDRETFKKIMPVITYEDLQPDISRIADGDTSPILSGLPISELLTSSGTSAGERKLMPTTEEEHGRRSLFYSLIMPVMNQYVPGLEKAKECFIRAIRFLENHWTLLCNDLRNGTINPLITDPSVREAVLKVIKPNPKLADFIEAECSRNSRQGIITSNGLPLVSTLYASSECYFGLNLKPLCMPSEVSYTLIPTMAYFEFMPIHRNNGFTNSISVPKSLNEKEQQELIDLADVKLGQEYELIVTTYAGLYRYRVGDVLRVSGFKNKAPQFKFVCRKNVVLSIDSDKTDEVELQNAVTNAVNNLVPCEATVVEYTSYADLSTIPGHYVLYWELRLDGVTPIPPSVFEDCCLTIEESLNSVYRQGRVSDKSIGPLEIKIVESGSFDKLMDYAISRGASMNQYKTPRCVKFEPIVELLNSKVVSSYFSPKCPNWIPGHKQWHN